MFWVDEVASGVFAIFKEDKTEPVGKVNVFPNGCTRICLSNTGLSLNHITYILEELKKVISENDRIEIITLNKNEKIHF